MKQTRTEMIYDALCSYDESHNIYDLYKLAKWINNRIKEKK